MIDELIELLVRLVVEGFISEEEALEVIRFAQANNRLPEGWQLPLEFDLAIPSELSERVRQALLFFETNRPSLNVDTTQSRFSDEVQGLANDLRTGKLSLKEWHAEMIEVIVIYLAEQASNGAAGGAIDDEEGFFALASTQVAFLSRFADQAATGRLSSARISERAKQYGGEGRGIYYQQAGLRSATYGWVEDYFAVDDRNTCGPCSNAEARGPYLPGQGPMPGRICLGRGYCRCTRVGRYDEAAYLRLGGT